MGAAFLCFYSIPQGMIPSFLHHHCSTVTVLGCKNWDFFVLGALCHVGGCRDISVSCTLFFQVGAACPCPGSQDIPKLQCWDITAAGWPQN